MNSNIKQYRITGQQLCEFVATVNATSQEAAEALIEASCVDGIIESEYVDTFTFDTVELDEADICEGDYDVSDHDY